MSRDRARASADRRWRKNHPSPTTPQLDRDINTREFQRYAARVYLAEARRRKDRDPSFAATLLQWAKNARNRSNALTARDIFGRLA